MVDVMAELRIVVMAACLAGSMAGLKEKRKADEKEECLVVHSEIAMAGLKVDVLVACWEKNLVAHLDSKKAKPIE